MHGRTRVTVMHGFSKSWNDLVCSVNNKPCYFLLRQRLLLPLSVQERYLVYSLLIHSNPQSIERAHHTVRLVVLEYKNKIHMTILFTTE
jgi:hypothetical protein